MQYQGLTSSAAREQLQKWGYNEIATQRARSFLNELKKIFLDPMGMMLLILSALYFALGDRGNAITLLIVFFPVTAVDIILRIQSGKALKALSGTLALSATLLRDGRTQELPIRFIVPDDILIFEEGKVLPADGVIIEAENLTVSEAALTGESVPVNKNIGDLFFGGTTILTGRGVGRVQKTGKNSQFGAIAQLMEGESETISPLRKTVNHMVKVMIAVAFVFAVFLLFIQWRSSNELIPSLIVALTFGMTAIPEEFPMVFTLYLSLGAWRLSKKKVLVKSLPSVEALGGVDVICTDKTGTLTEGVFQLEGIVKLDASYPDAQAWVFALMACETIAVDAMELPIVEKARPYQLEIKDWSLVRDFPFDSKTKTMSHVWGHSVNGQLRVAMKGAAEGVISHCAFTPEQKQAAISTLNRLAGQGKRVLGLAGNSIEKNGSRAEVETNLQFIGFLVYSDPLRPNVKDAIIACQNANIQIKMLTGDHLLTAHSIADQIGLHHSHEYLFTGEMISKMGPAERVLAYTRGAVFARVTPEQKFEMVKALQAQGKVVAMTGDGINDAPALQLADIGISMGKSATDVARSSARMILMNNDFTGIVTAVLEGRNIFANLRRSFSYLISFHIPVILLALLPPLLGWPAVLLPLHIILLELVVHPISAFTFENGVTKNPKKNTQGSLLTRAQVFRSGGSGLLLSFMALAIFGYLKSESPELARSAAFSCVLIGNIFFVLADTLPDLNRRFYLTATLLLISAIGITMTHAFLSYLHFEAVSVTQFGLIFIATAIATFPGFVKLKNLQSSSPK